MFTSENGDRISAQNYIVILTDGRADNYTEAWTQVHTHGYTNNSNIEADDMLSLWQSKYLFDNKRYV